MKHPFFQAAPGDKIEATTAKSKDALSCDFAQNRAHIVAVTVHTETQNRGAMCNSCIPKKLGDNTYKMLALQGHNFPLVHTSMFSFSTTQQLLSLMVMGEKAFLCMQRGC